MTPSAVFMDKRGSMVSCRALHNHRGANQVLREPLQDRVKKACPLYEDYTCPRLPLYPFIMSETRLIYFMYHHYQHCFISKGKLLPPPSTESFTVFPLLPTELRLKIWNMWQITENCRAQLHSNCVLSP